MDSITHLNGRSNSDDTRTPAREQQRQPSIGPDPGQPTTLLTFAKTPTSALERRQETSNLTSGESTIASWASTTPSITGANTNRATTTSSSSSSSTSIVVTPTCQTCLPLPTGAPTTVASSPPSASSALTASCATAHWTLIRLSTAYLWVPVAGCSGAQPECCVYSAAILPVFTTTVTKSAEDGGSPTATMTRTVTWDVMSEDVPFPTAAADATGATTLRACPADYGTVDAADGGTMRGCCPLGFTPAGPWGTAQTPCASRLYGRVTAPPVPASSLPSIGHMPVIQTITGQVFALEYALPPAPEGGDALTPAKKVGIGIGSGIAGILFGMLVGWGFIRNRRLDRAEARRQKGAAAEAAIKGEGVLARERDDGDGGEYSTDKGKGVDRSQTLGNMYKVYPVYPPPEAAGWYDPTAAEISPVSSTSPGTGTGSGTESWGTGTQPLWYAAGGSSGVGDMGQQATKYYDESSRPY